MTQTPTKTQILLARLAVGLIVAFAVLGVAMYGFSAEVRQRIWQNLLDRPSGPMTFRFFLQPIMASIAAGVAGVKDARRGRSPYLWTILTHPEKAGGRLHEGLIATARVILLGLVMDVIYQADGVRDVSSGRGGDHLDPARLRPLPAAARPDHARRGLVARPAIGERRPVRVART